MIGTAKSKIDELNELLVMLEEYPTHPSNLSPDTPMVTRGKTGEHLEALKSLYLHDSKNIMKVLHVLLDTCKTLAEDAIKRENAINEKLKKFETELVAHKLDVQTQANSFTNFSQKLDTMNDAIISHERELSLLRSRLQRQNEEFQRPHPSTPNANRRIPHQRQPPPPMHSTIYLQGGIVPATLEQNDDVHSATIQLLKLLPEFDEQSITPDMCHKLDHDGKPTKIKIILKSTMQKADLRKKFFQISGKKPFFFNESLSRKTNKLFFDLRELNKALRAKGEAVMSCFTRNGSIYYRLGDEEPVKLANETQLQALKRRLLPQDQINNGAN